MYKLNSRNQMVVVSSAYQRNLKVVWAQKSKFEGQILSYKQDKEIEIHCFVMRAL